PSLRPTPAARATPLLPASAGALRRGRPRRAARARGPAMRLGSPADRPYLPGPGQPGRRPARRSPRRTRHRPLRGGAAPGTGPGPAATVPRPLGHPAPVVHRLPPGAPHLPRLLRAPGAERGRLERAQPSVPDPRHAAGRPAALHAPPPRRAGLLAGRG